MILINNTPCQPKPEDALKATAVLFSIAVATSSTICTLYSKKKISSYCLKLTSLRTIMKPA